MAKLTQAEQDEVRAARQTLRARTFKSDDLGPDHWMRFEPAEFIGSVADVVSSELPQIRAFLALEVGQQLTIDVGAGVFDAGVAGRDYQVRRTS